MKITPWLPGIAKHYLTPQSRPACGAPVWLGDRFRFTADPYDVTCQRCFKTRAWRADFKKERDKNVQGNP